MIRLPSGRVRGPRYGARSCLRPAYTLAELSASMLITGILMLGITEVIFISAQVSEDTDNRRISHVSDGAGSLLRDLNMATAILRRSDTDIEFVVPDRNNDSAPETIAYAWSGSPGSPLTRRENGGIAHEIVSGVQGFLLSYYTGTKSIMMTVITPGEILEMGILFAFEGWPGGIPTTPQLFVVSATDWIAEFIEIDMNILPAGAKSIDIYRVDVKMDNNIGSGAAGASFSIGIAKSQGGGNPQPSANMIGTPAIMPTSMLTATPGWVSANFSDVSIRLVSGGNKADFVIVVKGSGAKSANVEYLNSGSAPNDGPTCVWTADSGAKWNPKKNQQKQNDMQVRIWAMVETVDVTQEVPVDLTLLRAVGVSLTAGTDSSNRLETTVRTLNQPEFSPP